MVESRKVKLEEFIVKRGSVNPAKFSNENFEYYSIPAYDRGTPEITKGENIGSSKKIISTNDVLLSRIVPHIRRAWLIKSKSKSRKIGSGEWIIFNSEKINSTYLKYFFHSEIFNSQFLNNLTGVGGSLMRANPGLTGKIKVPLPPLETQKEIAHLLDTADALRQKTQEQLDHLDALAQSIFLEMFGDPVLNEKGWEVEKLGDLFEIKHGFAFKSEFFKTQGKFKLLTPGNFYESGGFKELDEKQKFYVGEIPKDYILSKGQMLIAMTEQAKGLLGSVLFIPEDNCYLHNQRLGLLTSKKDVNDIFLFYILNSINIRAIIHHFATGTKVRHTSPNKLKELKIILPAVKKQNKFSLTIQNIESQKEKLKQSLKESEDLFNCLLQDVFG